MIFIKFFQHSMIFPGFPGVLSFFPGFPGRVGTLLISPFFKTFKNWLNAVLWCYLHVTLIKKIKGAAHKDDDIDGTFTIKYSGLCLQRLIKSSVEIRTIVGNQRWSFRKWQVLTFGFIHVLYIMYVMELQRFGVWIFTFILCTNLPISFISTSLDFQGINFHVQNLCINLCTEFTLRFVHTEQKLNGKT